MTQNWVQAPQKKQIIIFESGVAFGSVTQLTHAVSAVGMLFVHSAPVSFTFPIFR
jgi:hypothetical protein